MLIFTLKLTTEPLFTEPKTQEKKKETLEAKTTSASKVLTNRPTWKGSHTNSLPKSYYPNIGRHLTKDDIGKQVVRTHPFKNFDFSSIPSCGRPSEKCETLTNIYGINTLFLRNFMVGEHFSITNDGFWVTKDEFIAHMESPHFEKRLWDESKTVDPIKPSIRNSLQMYSYPNIGRLLTEDDIGKVVVRTHPYNTDCSYIPYSLPPTEKDQTLVCFDKNSITLRNNYHNFNFTLKNATNDGFWVTRDEFIEHLKSPNSKKRSWYVLKTVDQPKPEPENPPKTTNENLKGKYYYPKLGRLLTNTDVGKKVVRTRPFESGDLSYMPHPFIESPTITLIFAIDTLVLRSGIFSSSKESAAKNDGYWVTEEEFIAHTKSPHFEKCRF